MRKAAILFQSLGRMFHLKVKYKLTLEAAAIFQCFTRMHKQRKVYKEEVMKIVKVTIII